MDYEGTMPDLPNDYKEPAKMMFYNYLRDFFDYHNA